VVVILEVVGPTEVVNHLWKGRQKIFYVHGHITLTLSEFIWGLLGYSATMGRDTKKVWGLLGYRL